MTDFIIRFSNGVGYLPIIVIDGKEVYRGEHQRSSIEALQKCEDRAELLAA